MSPTLITLLDKNGYRIYQSKEYFILRKKVFTAWWILILFLFLGVVFFGSGMLIIIQSGSIANSVAIFFLVIGAGLMVTPFINYLTAAYRSLAIDLEHKTLLFRAGYSRAYLFTEVNDIKLEVQAKQTGTDPFSNSNKEFKYTITAYMSRGDKEELLALKFRDEESERLMFDLKDYLCTLLTYNN